MWHKVAKILHCTPREAQRRLTSAEFSEYIELIRRRDLARIKKRSKWEYYAASLTAEVRRGWVDKKSLIDDNNFLIKFVTKDEKEEAEKVLPDAEEVAKRQLAIEKYSWGVMSGTAIPVKKRKAKKHGSNPHPSKPSR